MNYLTLMSYVLTWAPDEPREATDSAWMHVFSEVMDQIAPTHHTILSTITLLSNSLLSGQSLPPFLPLPKPYEVTRQLLKLSEEHRQAEQNPSANVGGGGTSITSVGSGTSTRSNNNNNSSAGDTQPVTLGPDAWNLLDARNMEQKGYTEFAVLQVCSTLVIGDLEGLVRTVGNLVGTVDFSFRIDGGSDSSLESVDRTFSRATWSAPPARTGTGLGAEGEKGKRKVH